MSTAFFRHENVVPDLVGPEGAEVMLVSLGPDKVLEDAIVDISQRLTSEEGFDYSSIVVLSGSSTVKTTIPRGEDHFAPYSYRGVRFGPIEWWMRNPKHTFIPVGPVQRFAGLESSVVILTRIDRLRDSTFLETCYVGMSRARHLLIVVAMEETLERLRMIMAQNAPVPEHEKGDGF